MAKPEVTCTSSFCFFFFFFLQNKVSTLIFIDILWLFLIVGYEISAGNNFSYLTGHVSFQISILAGHVATLVGH